MSKMPTPDQRAFEYRPLEAPDKRTWAPRRVKKDQVKTAGQRLIPDQRAFDQCPTSAKTDKCPWAPCRMKCFAMRCTGKSIPFTLSTMTSTIVVD
jgi:hypothetical protein